MDLDIEQYPSLHIHYWFNHTIKTSKDCSVYKTTDKTTKYIECNNKKIEVIFNVNVI